MFIHVNKNEYESEPKIMNSAAAKKVADVILTDSQTVISAFFTHLFAIN